MRRAATLLLAALACSLPARAEQFWTALDDQVLAEARGGFALPNGLMVSFGIVRTVLVDGQVVSRTALQIPDVGNITTDQARTLGTQAGGLGIVQVGPGNTLQIPQTAVLPGLVIQNTLSNRQLQAVTEINATANSLRMLQGMNLTQSLADALRGAVPR